MSGRTPTLEVPGILLPVILCLRGSDFNLQVADPPPANPANPVAGTLANEDCPSAKQKPRNCQGKVRQRRSGIKDHAQSFLTEVCRTGLGSCGRPSPLDEGHWMSAAEMRVFHSKFEGPDRSFCKAPGCSSKRAIGPRSKVSCTGSRARPYKESLNPWSLVSRKHWVILDRLRPILVSKCHSAAF